jgi:hypothetical protein
MCSLLCVSFVASFEKHSAATHQAVMSLLQQFPPIIVWPAYSDHTARSLGYD